MENAEPLRVSEGKQIQSSGMVTEVCVYHSSTFQQFLSYGYAYDGNDPQQVLVINRTWIQASQAWQEEEYLFSASYVVLEIRPKTRDHFYVLGRASNGDDVIEKWKKANIGQPGGGGGYSIQRTELYRGATLGGVRTIGADPDGRYLLLVHGTPKTLSRMTLTPGYPISTLYTTMQIGHLAAVSSLFPRQHVTLGRVWTLESLKSPDAALDRTFLIDTTNDGVIDSWTTVDFVQYKASYEDPADWTGFVFN